MQNVLPRLSMPNQWHYLFLLLSLVLFHPLNAMAGTSNDFNKGKTYFKQGQYDKAIKYFKLAQKKGMEKTALDYNLGVSYFKIENYDKAEAYFRKILKSKNMKSLAQYNLGLVALKKDDKKTAGKWFNKSQNTTNKKIAELSRQQLQRLTPKKSASSTKNWYSYASLSYGYNSNIKLAPVEIATDTSDTYLDFYASTSGTLSGTYTDGYSLDAFASFINYTDVDTYDEKQARIGLYKNKTYADWRTRIGAYYDRSTFGSTDFQSIIGLEAKGKLKLGKTNSASLRYRYNDISSLDNIYDYLNGWRQQFRAQYMDYTAKGSKRIYYELELNDRQNNILNGRNYSPTRHKFFGIYRYNIAKAWRIGGELSYRYSEYQPTATQNRQDDRLRAAIEARYKISKMWKANGRYQFTDNSSTDNIYDYTQNLYYLGIEASF